MPRPDREFIVGDALEPRWDDHAQLYVMRRGGWPCGATGHTIADCWARYREQQRKDALYWSSPDRTWNR